MIKQDRLVRELYQASLDHDAKKIAELRKIEFQKILRRRESGKPFTTHWALVRI